jgi:hypothetical protein
MASPRRYLNLLNGWEQAATAVAANAAELPHLETPRAKLLALLEQARSLTAQQSVHTANKQEATKQLQRVIREGQVLVDFLRTGAREHFGISNEKLVEFGVQPFRGRARASKPAVTPAPEQPSPSTPNPGPVTPK